MHSENTRQPTLLHLQTTSIWTNVTNMLSWPSRQLKKTCVPRHCQFKFSQICLTWLPWSNVNVCLVQSKETSRFGRVTNFSDLSKIIFSGFVMVNNTELCDKLRVLKMLFLFRSATQTVQIPKYRILWTYSPIFGKVFPIFWKIRFERSLWVQFREHNCFQHCRRSFRRKWPNWPHGSWFRSQDWSWSKKFKSWLRVVF